MCEDSAVIVKLSMEESELLQSLSCSFAQILSFYIQAIFFSFRVVYKSIGATEVKIPGIKREKKIPFHNGSLSSLSAGISKVTIIPCIEKKLFGFVKS